MTRIRKWLQKTAFQHVYRQHHNWLMNPDRGVQMTFRDRILEKVDFHGAHISASDFSESNLQDSDFYKANLQRGVFREADLTGADFNSSIMDFADISTAHLRKAKHQIHIRNRQKEDLQALLEQARDLWTDAELLHRLAGSNITIEASHAIALQRIAGNFKNFLSKWQVKRPYANQPKELS